MNYDPDTDFDLLLWHKSDIDIAPPLSDFETAALVKYTGKKYKEVKTDLRDQLEKYLLNSKSKFFNREFYDHSKSFFEFLDNCNDIAMFNLATLRLDICEYAPAIRVTLLTDIFLINKECIKSFESICKNSKSFMFIPDSESIGQCELMIDFNFNCK